MSFRAPGPWKLRPVASPEGHRIIGPRGGYIASVPRNGNAKLVKAAPDLLDACKSVLHGLDVVARHGHESILSKVHRDTLRRAIKRAGDYPKKVWL